MFPKQPLVYATDLPGRGVVTSYKTAPVNIVLVRVYASIYDRCSTGNGRVYNNIIYILL